MGITRVVHVRKEPYDLYIGRSFAEFGESIWHNPFKLGPQHDGNRKEVLAKYRAYLLANTWLLAHIHEVYEKTLGCWCGGVKGKNGCHGDIIASVADAPADKCLWCGASEIFYHFVEPPYLPACEKHRGKVAAICICRQGEAYHYPEFNKEYLDRYRDSLKTT